MEGKKCEKAGRVRATSCEVRVMKRRDDRKTDKPGAAAATDTAVFARGFILDCLYI